MINPDGTVANLLTRHSCAARVLLSRRMHCVGCVIAPSETIAEACLVYAVPLADLVSELEACAEAKEECGAAGTTGPFSSS